MMFSVWRPVLSLLLAGALSFATCGPVVEAQSATPATATDSDERLASGPLGEQITWLVDYINLPESDADGQDIATKFTPEVLAQAPADILPRLLGQIRAQMAPVVIKPGSIVTTRDEPPASAQFLLLGENGIELPATLGIDHTSGLINTLWFGEAMLPAGTPEAAIEATPEILVVASTERTPHSSA